MAYEAFSFRTKQQVYAMGRMAAMQEAFVLRKASKRPVKCALISPDERRVWRQGFTDFMGKLPKGRLTPEQIRAA